MRTSERTTAANGRKWYHRWWILLLALLVGFLLGLSIPDSWLHMQSGLNL